MDLLEGHLVAIRRLSDLELQHFVRLLQAQTGQALRMLPAPGAAPRSATLGAQLNALSDADLLAFAQALERGDWAAARRILRDAQAKLAAAEAAPTEEEGT